MIKNSTNPINNLENKTEYSVEELLTYIPERIEAIDLDKLKQTDPILIAEFLTELELPQQREILGLIPIEQVGKTLTQMDASQSANIISAIREEHALVILNRINLDDAADIFAELKEKDRWRLLEGLEPKTAKAVVTLLNYGAETAGGVMNPEVATVTVDMKVDEAINHIRKLHQEMEDLSYVYVIDHERRLKGVLSMRDLILARSDQPVETIMNTKIKGVTYLETDKEKVALTFARYNLISLPVVDKNNHLMGIVTANDVIDIIQDEATEDIQKFVGAGGDETIRDKVSYSVKRRQPWLQVNLITALLASGVIFFFQEAISQFPILAVFLPIIASMGGNSGAQTLSIAIRSLALGTIENKDHRKFYIKESVLGLLNGLPTGFVCSLIAWLITKDIMIASIIFISIIANMILAGLTGAFIPLFLKRIGIDPAQSAFIFLTTITDIAGFLIFLVLGAFLLL